jgi:hypothetical protein
MRLLVWPAQDRTEQLPFPRFLRPDPFYLGYTLSRRALGETLAHVGYRVTDTTAIDGPRLPAAIGRVLGALEGLEGALRELAARLDGTPNLAVGGRTVIPATPLSFYLRLVSCPLTRARGSRRFSLTALLALAQIATVMGYWRERLARPGP